MKILIPGGSGQIGIVLKRAFEQSGDEVVILGRNHPDPSHRWDGATLGPWTTHLDQADIVINLAGRTVNCRYTKENLTKGHTRDCGCGETPHFDGSKSLRTRCNSLELERSQCQF